MGKTKELFLVHAEMQRITLIQSVNVMLTPQFYTLKKEALPVKYAYQAKKIAASLFEGLLEDVGTYEYLVYKEQDTWVFIAYNPAQIQSLLLSKGIKPEQVSKLFFAQQALDMFTSPLSLGDKESLVVIDNTVVVVPSIALGEDEQPSLTFNTDFTPKQGVTLKTDNASSMLTQKQAISLAVVFTLFAGLFLFEGSRYGGDGLDSEAEIQRLYEAYPALNSSYTRDAELEKYSSIDKNERKKRDAIKAFSGMIFKGVTLTALHVDEKAFKAQFSCADAEVAKRVKALAKKAQYNTSKVKGSTDLSIEGTL